MYEEEPLVLVVYGTDFPTDCLRAPFWASWLPQRGKRDALSRNRLAAATLPFGMEGGRLWDALPESAQRCPGFEVRWREDSLPEAALVVHPDHEPPYVIARWRRSYEGLVTFSVIEDWVKQRVFHARMQCFDLAALIPVLSWIAGVVVGGVGIMGLIVESTGVSFSETEQVMIGVLIALGASLFSALLLLGYGEKKQKRAQAFANEALLWRPT